MAVRPVGGPLAVEVGEQGEPAGPGGGREGETVELLVVDAEQPAHGVGHLRGVEGADQREVASGGVGEPGDDARGVRGRFVADAVDRARGPDRHHHVGGPQPDAHRAGHVVAGPGADHGAVPLARRLDRPEHRRDDLRPVPLGVDEARAGRAGTCRSPRTSSRCPRRRPGR